MLSIARTWSTPALFCRRFSRIWRRRLSSSVVHRWSSSFEVEAAIFGTIYDFQSLGVEGSDGLWVGVLSLGVAYEFEPFGADFG